MAKLPLTFVRLGGFEPLPLHVALPMSATRLVPAAVPFERHNSWPWVLSLAAKNSVPFTFVRLMGVELGVVELMSSTKLVPAGTPFERHNSRLWAASVAAKKSVPPTLVR